MGQVVGAVFSLLGMLSGGGGQFALYPSAQDVGVATEISESQSISAKLGLGGEDLSGRLGWQYRTGPSQFDLGLKKDTSGKYGLDGAFRFENETLSADVSLDINEGLPLLEGERTAHLNRDPYTTLTTNVDVGTWSLFGGYTQFTPRFRDEPYTQYGVGVAKDLGNHEIVTVARAAREDDFLGSVAWAYRNDKLRSSARITAGQADLTRDDFVFEGAENASQVYAAAGIALSSGWRFDLFGGQAATYDASRETERLLTALPRSRMGNLATLSDFYVGEGIVEDSLGASASYGGRRHRLKLQFKTGDQWIRGVDSADGFMEIGARYGFKGTDSRVTTDIDSRKVETSDATYQENRLFFDAERQFGPLMLGFGGFARGSSADDLFSMIAEGEYASAGGSLRAQSRVWKGHDLGVAATFEDNAGSAHKVARAMLTYGLPRGEFGIGMRLDITGMERFETQEESPFLFADMQIGEFAVRGSVDTADDGVFLSIRRMVGDSVRQPNPFMAPGLGPMLGFTGSQSTHIPAGLGPENLSFQVHNCGSVCMDPVIDYLSEFRNGISGIRTAPRVRYDLDPSNPEFFEVDRNDPFIDFSLSAFDPQNVLIIIDDIIDEGPDAKPDPGQIKQKILSFGRAFPDARNIQCMNEPLNFSNITPLEYARRYSPACREAVDELNLDRPLDQRILLWSAPWFGNSDGVQQSWEFVRAGGLRYFDVLSAHIYADSTEKAVKLAEEYKAMSHGTPVALTETNFADGGWSSYDAQEWWLTETLPALERVLKRGLVDEDRDLQQNFLYTLAAATFGFDFERQYNFITTVGNAWIPAGPGHNIIASRANALLDVYGGQIRASETALPPDEVGVPSEEDSADDGSDEGLRPSRQEDVPEVRDGAKPVRPTSRQNI